MANPLTPKSAIAAEAPPRPPIQPLPDAAMEVVYFHTPVQTVSEANPTAQSATSAGEADVGAEEEISCAVGADRYEAVHGRDAWFSDCVLIPNLTRMLRYFRAE